MANRAEVKCINKDERQNPYERITHIGGYVTSAWKLTQSDAIGMIERKEWEFFVKRNGSEVKVIVAVSRFGNLKTEADGEEPNNLLSLPECP